MAYLTIENATVTGAQAIFNLKELMKSAGYTVMSSSDGTTYNSSGDQITTGSSGANGMANNRAWFRIQSPDGVNEWVFQRDSTNVNWRIVCNYGGAAFIGGSPAATVTPDSANGVTPVGGGSSASPTFGANFLQTDSSYRWKALVDDEAPYGWWAGGVLISGSTPATAMVWDPLVATHPSDTFNYVFYISGMNNTAAGTLNVDYGISNGGITGGRESILTRYPSGTLGTALHVGMMKYINWDNTNLLNYNSSLSSGIAVNPISSADEYLPVMYCRSTSTSFSHFKGISTFLKYRTINRATGTVGDYGDGRFSVVMRDFVLPWDKTTFTL